MLTTIYFVRHAQSRPLPETPEPEWELSARGREQARALVPIIASWNVDVVYSSPFRRCRETLEPFAKASGRVTHLHDGLRERCISPRWQGDFREIWTRSWKDFGFALEGGEDSWTCRRRITDAAAEIVLRHAGRTIVLGSHGNAIALFVNALEPTFLEKDASAMRTPEIIKCVHERGEFRWVREYSAGPAFDAIATDFRQTPGVIA